MEIIIKTEKDFCDCKDCIKEFLKEFSKQFKMGVVKGEFKITDNQNKVNWEILNTDIDLEENKSKNFFISCCDKKIKDCEEGVNGSDFFKCNKCGSCYNVIYSTEEEK